MQLTNYSFLDSRKNYISSLSQQKIASDRVSTGNRFENAGTDVGALGQNARLRSDRLQMQSRRVALQNFNTFLDTQQKTLQQVRGIYERMSSLAHQALDPTLSESSNGGNSDKELLNTEFGELSAELSKMITSKVNGQLLFGGTKADFTEGLQDRNMDPTATSTPQIITKDVMTTSGTLTIKLAPGPADDQVWVLKGDLDPAIFDKFFTPSNSKTRNANLIQELEKIWTKQGLFTTGSWQTTGNSQIIGSDGDFRYDTFQIKFSDCDTDVDFTPHPDNSSTNFGQDLYNKGGADSNLKHNVPTENSTKITMIGINSPGNDATYEVEANFEPILSYNDIEVPGGAIHRAISFGQIDCANINSSSKALKVLASLETEIANLTNSMAQVASSQRRYESEINHMENTDVFNESALGRISDTDYAKESTQFAKESIRMGLATQVMSNTTRLTDVLIPLTTNHFRGGGLSSTL
jgi:flagellin-like hook-associated protein FlgL